MDTLVRELGRLPDVNKQDPPRLEIIKYSGWCNISCVGHVRPSSGNDFAQAAQQWKR